MYFFTILKIFFVSHKGNQIKTELKRANVATKINIFPAIFFNKRKEYVQLKEETNHLHGLPSLCIE